MNKKFFKNCLLAFAGAIALASCQKTEYAFGDLASPSDLTLTAAVTGVDAANPGGNGSGAVAVTTTASKVITYKIDFGDGKVLMVPSGTINYKYTTPGVNDYTITVSAVGAAGSVSNISKKVKVFVAFEIPSDILQNLTGGSSKRWTCDKDADGHFGVGPNDGFPQSTMQQEPIPGLQMVSMMMKLSLQKMPTTKSPWMLTTRAIPLCWVLRLVSMASQELRDNFHWLQKG